MSPESKKIIKAHAQSVISHRHFTPERIRRLVADVVPKLANGTLPPNAAEIKASVHEALANPTQQMRATFRSLPIRHRWFLYALLETEERVEAICTGRGTHSETLRKAYEALCPHEHQVGFDTVAAEMSEAFVKRSPALLQGSQVTWIHPSCRDLTIEELMGNSADRLQFLRFCSETGIQLATSVGGGDKGRRQLPLLRCEADWKALEHRSLELIGDGKGMLGLLWKSYQALQVADAGFDSSPSQLGRFHQLITASVLPAAARALENTRSFTELAFVKDFFEVRAALKAQVSFDPTAIWRDFVQDAMESMPEDTVVWESCNAIYDFAALLLLIQSNEPSFLDVPWVADSLKAVTDELRDRGQRESETTYSVDEDDLQNAVDGYETLSTAYKMLAGANDVPLGKRKDFEEIAFRFQHSGEELQEGMPGEPDYEEGGGWRSHAPSDSDVGDLFRDL